MTFSFLPTCEEAPARYLLAEAESAEDCSVALDVDPVQVGQKATAPSDELEETSLGVIVMLMHAHMACELCDTLSEECDLHFRGACIPLMHSMLDDNFSFVFLG